MDEPRGRRRIRPVLTLGAFGLIVAVGMARADLIYLRGGASLQVPAAEDGDQIVVRLPDRGVRIHREDVTARVAGFWPPDEWPDRLEAARRGSFATRFANAWWAIENGLTIEVIPELRALHHLDPSHGPTSRMVAVLDRLDRPCPDPDASAFRRALRIEPRVARGPHVLLFHQHDDAEADERIDVLERVLLGFHLLFAAEGLELRTPREKLVSAWFAHRKDYRAFLHREGADAFATTAGYYHPTWNAVVAFDSRSVGKQRLSRETLRGYRSSSRREEHEVEVREALLDLDWRSHDLGLAAHEMVHQLTWDSGLSPRHDAIPIWLHEGLAMQFEVIRGGRWAGIGRVNDHRLPDWRSRPASGSLERLLRDVEFGRGYRRDAYARAWALVYDLRARHGSGFVTFLDLLRNPETGVGSVADGAPEPEPIRRGDRLLTSFRRAFGEDLDAIDRDWRTFMSGIRTPIEQHAPRPVPSKPPR